MNNASIYPWNRGQWRALQRAPSLPSALLLAGPGGLGKRQFARALAQGILCGERERAGEGCGECLSCRLFASASHPDFRLIEPAAADDANEAPAEGGGVTSGQRQSRVIVVAQVRDIDDFLGVKSHLGGAKVVLIQPAERLHPSAANALLKTLEEPGSGTVFILVSDRPQQLFATVRSRCFRVDFALPAARVTLDWLRAQGIPEPETALAQAGFAPLAAADLARGDFWARRATLTHLLAAPDAAVGEVTARINAEELPLLCGLLYRWCYDLLSLRLTGRVRYNPDCAKSLQRLADKVQVLRVQDLLKDIVAAARALEHPLNARLAIERLAIQYVRTIAPQES